MKFKPFVRWYSDMWKKKEWEDSEGLDMAFISLYLIPIIGGIIMLVVAIINDIK